MSFLLDKSSLASGTLSRCIGFPGVSVNMEKTHPACAGWAFSALGEMEERKEKIERLEPKDHAVGFPAETAVVLREFGGGQRLGQGGEKDAPPHGGTVKQHGQKARRNGNQNFVAQFHKKHRPNWN